MSKGRITIPTDETFVEGTKRIAKLWGADAVRDCDGVKLPDNPHEIAGKVYNVYFVDRGNHEWAKNNPDEWQHVLVSTPFITATEKTLRVSLMDTFYAEQVKPDFSADALRYLEVIDRTTGEVHAEWTADEKNNEIIISDAELFHQYTVSFFMISLWHPVHMYNYITNGWNEPHHIMYDPYYPKTSKFIRENLKKWCDDNPDCNVVRFTTFLYMFSLVYNHAGKERNVDWFGYNMAVSPRMFDDFGKKYGYKMRAEYLIDQGYYNQTHRVPSKEYKDYMDFVQSFVTETVKDLVTITHEKGKEAMMFLGDCWIGAEIYGDRFKELNLDAIVGSVGGGVTVRMLSDVQGVKYKEGRFLPYFFPDTFFDGNEENAVKELSRNWITARRAMMRNPLDRIGFGGYLSLAAKFPKFIARAGEICDEFRNIYDIVKTKNPMSFAKVAVLNAWGKIRSWMCNMTAHELWYQQSYSYQGIYEALSGLPVDVSFIDFDDVKKGRLKDFDVIINAGDAGTAWSGGENWADEKVVAEVREFVYNGGGFIGVGEPAALQRNRKFFQLSDVMGVDKECGISLGEDKYNIGKHENHFILQDVETPLDYGEDKKNIYALDGTDILDIAISDRFRRNYNIGEVKMATKDYGAGRSFYITGLPYSADNARLLYRAILWTAHKENLDRKAYSANKFTEAHCYCDRYAVINNTDSVQETDFYDIEGKKKHLTIEPYGIKWL